MIERDLARVAADVYVNAIGVPEQETVRLTQLNRRAHELVGQVFQRFAGLSPQQLDQKAQELAAGPSRSQPNAEFQYPDSTSGAVEWRGAQSLRPYSSRGASVGCLVERFVVMTETAPLSVQRFAPLDDGLGRRLLLVTHSLLTTTPSQASHLPPSTPANFAAATGLFLQSRQEGLPGRIHDDFAAAPTIVEELPGRVQLITPALLEEVGLNPTTKRLTDNHTELLGALAASLDVLETGLQLAPQDHAV